MLEKLNKENMLQFISYFFVGGMAAIVEWIGFYLFASVLHIYYIVSTVLAFIVSTTVNWLLGKKITFKENKKYQNKAKLEGILIFAVSAIGLLFNMGLMFVFIDICGFNDDLPMTLSKVAATGIVFFWNFFARKLWVYQEK